MKIGNQLHAKNTSVKFKRFCNILKVKVKRDYHVNGDSDVGDIVMLVT